MSKYRIVTNGSAFRIQQMIGKGLFTKREKWRFLGRYFPPGSMFPYFRISDFSTYDEAKNIMDKMLKEDEIAEQPWTIVSANPPIQK